MTPPLRQAQVGCQTGGVVTLVRKVNKEIIQTIGEESFFDC